MYVNGMCTLTFTVYNYYTYSDTYPPPRRSSFKLLARIKE